MVNSVFLFLLFSFLFVCLLLEGRGLIRQTPSNQPSIEMAGSCFSIQPTHDDEEIIDNSLFFKDDFKGYKTNPYDYNDIEYPVPFYQVFTQKAYHTYSLSDINASFPSYIVMDTFPSFENHFSDVLLLTGSDDKKAVHAFSCLYSILLADPYASILFVDRGLNEENIKKLIEHFNHIHQLQERLNSNGVLGYRKVNWASFPVWMKESESIRWIILHDVMNEWKGIVGWSDVSAELSGKLSEAIPTVYHYGVYSSGGERKVMESEFLHSHGLSQYRSIRAYTSTPILLLFMYDHNVTKMILDALDRCGFTKKCMEDGYETIVSMLIHEKGVLIKPSLERPMEPIDSLLQKLKENYHV